jgi:large conductance mechanosensitive channel
VLIYKAYINLAVKQLSVIYTKLQLYTRVVIKNMARARRRAGGFIKDFQDFALKGNVVDLAIAVIIGGAFGKIVASFVENVVMPCIDPILKIFGNDWRNLAIGATKFKDGIPQDGIRIGNFLGTVVDFAIIALVLFVAIQAIQRFKRQEEVEAAEETAPPDPNVIAQEKLTGALTRLTQTLESRSSISQ